MSMKAAAVCQDSLALNKPVLSDSLIVETNVHRTQTQGLANPQVLVLSVWVKRHSVLRYDANCELQLLLPKSHNCAQVCAYVVNIASL